MTDILVEILDISYKLDRKASQIYANFSKAAEISKLKSFWNKVSAEEHEHTVFWKRLLDMARKGMLPNVFDHPSEVLKELKETLSRIDALVERSRQIRSIDDAFLIAYRLEFYMLHPQFESLFHLMETVSGEHTPGNYYEDHLRSFVEALKEFQGEATGMEFLGETIIRIRELTKQIALQSHIDFLTGILNRRGIFNTIIPLSYIAQRNNYTVGLMMIDIDHFKKINDIHGNLKGDEVLRSTAQIIKSGIRSSDIAGRYGGEEFLIYLSNVAPEHLFTIAEKVRKAVESQSSTGIPVTISIGASCGLIRENIESEVDGLIQKADIRLYAAKESGRNRVVVE